MRLTLSLLMLLCTLFPALAADVTGTVVDAKTGDPIADANILLGNQAKFVTSDSEGRFVFTDVKQGTETLRIVAYGFNDVERQINIPAAGLKLGTIQMDPSDYDAILINSDDFTFDESQVIDDEGSSQAIGTILGARDDVYYQTANYNFSVMRFRWRGLNSDWTEGYVNGVDLNDAMRGRFNYSMMGGMTSSAFRNRTTEVGLAAAQYGFSNIGGSSNFTTYASDYAPGFRGNLTYTNSNYMLRAMLQYSTGVNKHGWAFSASVIGRYAPEGVIEGTFYNSFGYALSLQKIFNEHHSLNLSTWGAPTQRATNAAATQEAYDLAGSNLYNPSWGYLNGKKKSARVVNSFDPSVLLNWIWKPTRNTTLNTAAGFRYNAYSSSALNWYQAADPRPDYYRYLPSYHKPTAEEGTPLYDAQMEVYQTYYDLWTGDKAFRQIDWDGIYQTNLLNRDFYDRNPEYLGQSTYILEKRHSNFTSWMLNSYINHRFNEAITLQGGVSFNYTDASFFKTIGNLLGGEFWRDIDNYAERDFPGNPEMLQNNLNDPNRLVTTGERFGYDYNIRSIKAKAWLQNEIVTRHWDVNYGIEISYTNFMRHGNMRNGRAPENSYGAGLRHTFDNAAIKAGATYKLNGRNYFVLHAAYGTRAPLPDYSYISPRVKDTAVSGLSSERFLSGDISYVWNYSKFRGSITGFWTDMWDGIKRLGFYDYNYNTFMNYSMSGMHTEYKGIELGLAYKIIPSLTLSAAGTFARYQYKNNPLGTRSYENGTEADITTTVYLKNYHIGGTPQQAYSIGLDWAAPQQWFLGINGNFFCDNYIDLSPTRHEAMPELYGVVNTESELLAKIEEITHQDRLKDAFVLNLSVGKLFYTRFGSVNLNLSINNLLNNRNIQTGGYQEGKFDYTNYSTTKFPNKIYYAQGIRIYFNVGIRF